MPREFKAKTSQKEFEQLHETVSRAKRGTMVRVDKKALLHLLMDHSTMVREITGSISYGW